VLEAESSAAAVVEPPKEDVSVGAAVCFSLLSVPVWVSHSCHVNPKNVLYDVISDAVLHNHVYIYICIQGASTYMALQRYRVVKAEAQYASDVTAFPTV